MRMWSRCATGLAVALIMLWTGTALGQSKPACGPQGTVKTPDKVGGQVVKIDQSKVTVREADGTVHEFQASAETSPGPQSRRTDRGQAQEAPKC